VRKFDRRMRTVQVMVWFAVTFMGAASIFAGVPFFRTRGEGRSAMALYALLFLWTQSVVGFAKMWLFLMQNHIRTMKELKRVQMMMLES